MKYQLDVFLQETKEVATSVELELEVEPKNILLKQGYGYRLVKLEEDKFELDGVSTKELVDELKRREGVDFNMVESHCVETFEFFGPSIILKIED